VVPAAGIQSEMELAFVGSYQLVAPTLDRLERLPVPQRDAVAEPGSFGGWIDQCSAADPVVG
jgi:hypothetical protein